MKKETKLCTTIKQVWNDLHAPVTFFVILNKIALDGVQSQVWPKLFQRRQPFNQTTGK